MNQKTLSPLAARRRHALPRRGVALLLVLGCLVLLTTLILALLLSGQSNLKSSRLYANGSSVRALADSTVSLVMAQIQQATSNGTTVAWASQPGMIRTYDNTGAPLTNYRLFSWDSPTIPGAYDASTDETQLSSSASNLWYNSPPVYVDLNQPVTDSSGTAHYPIIDGNPSDLTAYTTAAPSNNSVLTYMTGANPTIEGFWVTPPNAAAANATDTAPATPAGPAVLPANTNKAGANIIPMPVKWLYVLKDGTVVAPAAASSGTTVTIKAATSSNPIVGRIAYWTDDETAKVNINTASEGNFMDTPRVQGATDNTLAANPPVQNEYQRYPGHPAMTCLSSVLGSIYPIDHTVQTYAPYQPYYDLAPKLNFNSTGNLGSQAGTVNNAVGNPALTLKNDRLYSSVDELMFASNLFTDNAPHSASATLTGGGGTRPLTQSGANPAFNQAFLEKAKFFLTANSRAPDVNLFNLPRIGAWPINVNTGSTYRTVFDQAIAFCGTIDALPYYFQRQQNDSPTNDLPLAPGGTGLGRNRTLMTYLETLGNQPIPGFGGTFTSKYTALETDQIFTEIFDYIRCLNLVDQSSGTTTFHPFAPVASTAAPNNYSTTYAGTNGTGSPSGLTANAGQGIVVPIYDSATKTKGFGRFPTISEVSLIFIATGWNDGNGGSSTDINAQVNTGTRAPVAGGSSSSTTTAATPPVTTYYWGYYNDGTNGKLATNPLSPSFKTQPVNSSGTSPALPVIPSGNIQVQAALLISFFDPSQGYVMENGIHSVQVLGLDNFTWGPVQGSPATANMGFPGVTNSSSNLSYTSNMAASQVVQYATSWGGNLGFRNFLATEQAGLPATSTQYYPFFSNAKNFPYTPPSSPGTFFFSGGDITINILLPSTSNWTSSAASNAGWPLSNAQTSNRPPIQQINVTFPAVTLPVPTYPLASFGPTGTTPFVDRGSFNNRLVNGTSDFEANAEFTVPQDVVRSVRAYPGDIRMIAGQVLIQDTASHPATTGPGYFDPTQLKIKASGLTGWDYFNSTINLVHSLRESIDYPFLGAVLGQLVPVTAPNYYAQPSGGAAIVNNYSSGLNSSSGAGNNASLAGAFIGGGTSGSPGDWDNGMGATSDGPYINKADEGNFDFFDSSGHPIVPYFGDSNYGATQAGKTCFSPNRLMPGPGMFGSLSTGVIRNIPWQTLLFCPNPAAGPSHPGFGSSVSGTTGAAAMPPYNTPPDHLIMDLFNMPVVEPYPITEPLSTAGRINMNYQIVPFTYIERSTGLRAVLKGERMTVIPDNMAASYKQANGTNAPISNTYDYRVPINSDQTLLAFDNYFSANKDIFRSATQICSMFLYPTRDALLSLTSGPTWDSANKNITMFWNGNTTGNGYSINQAAPTNASWPTHYLTGDNSRERPYATIYPRLTTKSNTYTIHYDVQTLQKITGSDPTLWNENSDVVTGEYRGSTTIERFIDPNDSSLIDFASSPTTALDKFYKFRVVSSKQFAP